MNFCGIDISKKHIGFSIYYHNTLICSPLCVIKNKDEIFIKKINDIKNFYKNPFFVIGLPEKNLHFINYKFIKDFTHKFRNLLYPFDFMNENYTTHLSYKFNIDDQDRMDDIASSLFLKDYLIEKKILTFNLL